MIIFGWTTRIKPTARHGQFHCPHCQVSTTYAECRRITYFRLFVIPILPLSDNPHGIQCCACTSTYDDSVLSYADRSSRPGNARNAGDNGR